MANERTKSRLKWEGDSQEVISSWADAAKKNIGGDLRRLQDYEDPLDSKHIEDGILELRDRDMHFWYRLLYKLQAGWIYVLHCFTKTTNQISKRDINLAKARLKAVDARQDKPFVKEGDEGEEEKSA